MIHFSDASCSLSTPLSPAQVDSLFLHHLALTSLFVRPPSSLSGSFHKICIVSLPPVARDVFHAPRRSDRHPSGRQTVHSDPQDRNEVGCLTVARQAGMAVPETIFSSADTDVDLVGFEYICSDFVDHPSLESVSSC